MDFLVSETSNEVRPETHDQVVNQVSDLVKQFNNRLTLDNRRLSERYIKNEVHVLIKTRFAGQDYVAVFERHSHVMELKAGPSVSLKDQECAVNADHCHDEVVMFVRDVELMEPVESVCSSAVWLGLVDSVYGRLRHSLYFSNVHSFVFIGSVEDRETGLRRGHTAVGDHKLIGQVVQSAPQIVNNIPGHESKILRRGSDINDLKDIIARLGIGIGLNEIRLWFDEPIPSGFQILEMLFCPFDFRPNKP